MVTVEEYRVESDTMGATFSITDQNFIQEQHQIAIKNCAWTVLNRLEQFIFTHPKLKTIVMMDPDAFIRGKLNIPDDAKLLGSRVNHGFPQALNNVMLQIELAYLTMWPGSATP